MCTRGVFCRLGIRDTEIIGVQALVHASLRVCGDRWLAEAKFCAQNIALVELALMLPTNNYVDRFFIPSRGQYDL